MSTSKDIRIPKTDVVFQCLRKIPQYSSVKDIHLRQVDIESIFPLARFIVKTRLSFSRKILSIISEVNIEPYKPFFFRATNENWRLIMPPVIERHDKSLFVFDGLHRLWLAKAEGIRKPWVICINDPPMPLPSTPRSWDHVIHTDTQLPVSDNLLDMDKSLIRPLSRYFKSNLTLYENLDADMLELG